MFADRTSPYIIAEVGSGHAMSLDRALLLIDAAVDAGADAAKFQLFRADTMYPEGERREATRKWEMPAEWLPALAKRCTERGMDFGCSAFDGETAALVDPHIKWAKVASLELTWDSLLRCVAQKGKPILLSTGAADIRQVIWALGLIRSEAPDLEVVLLHCVAAYPAPLEEANLLAIVAMSAQFEVRVGLSDHTTDYRLVPAIATALGAPVIEKHFRLDDDVDTPDRPHSLTPEQFREMVRVVRAARVAMGNGVKRVMPSEQSLRLLQRGPKGLRGE